MRSPYRSRRIAAAAAALALLCAPLAAGAGEPGEAREVAFVTSVEGEAEIVGPGGARRAAVCDAVVREGERVVTAEGGEVGLLAGDLLVQVAESTDAGFSLTPQNVAALDLERGAVRSFDARTASGAPPAPIRTPNAAVTAARADVEASVLPSKAGRYTMVCAWQAPLRVERLGGGAEDAAVGAPEQCVFVRPGQAIYTAPARGHRIALASGEACREELVGALGEHFLPTDVALPPPVSDFLPPLNPDTTTYGPCDEPGNLCRSPIAPISQEPPFGPPIEPPPVPECPPGAPCGNVPFGPAIERPAVPECPPGAPCG